MLFEKTKTELKRLTEQALRNRRANGYRDEEALPMALDMAEHDSGIERLMESLPPALYVEALYYVEHCTQNILDMSKEH